MSEVDSGGLAGSGSSGSKEAFARPPSRPNGRPPKPDHELVQPRRRPLKGSAGSGDFSAPKKPLAIAPVEKAVETPAEPERDPQDWIEYGQCFAEIHIGFYASKSEPLLDEARKKLPPAAAAALEVTRTKLLVPERTKANLEKGYGQIAEYLSLPAGGAPVAAFVNAVWTLHRTQMAALAELREFVRSLPAQAQP